MKIYVLTINNKHSIFKGINEEEKKFNNYIIDYPEQKKEIFEKVCLPLIEPKTTELKQPSILISGPDNGMLYSITHGMDMYFSEKGIPCTGCNVSNSTAENVYNNVLKQLEYNKIIYQNTHKKSAIIINDIEYLLGINAHEMYDNVKTLCSQEDFEIVKNNKTEGMINRFKSILDNCHQTPDNNKEGSATVFVFTSKNPHLIHPDFRDGKMNKLYFDFINGNNIINFLFDSFNKAMSLFISADNIERFKDSSDRINDLTEIDKNPQIRAIISNMVKPNEFTGCYSCGDLFMAVRNSILSILTTTPYCGFLERFSSMISQTTRSFSPETFLRYQNIRDSIIKNNDEYETLMALDEDGMLDTAKKTKLNELMSYEKRMLKMLIQKYDRDLITPDETALLRRLATRYKG